MSNTIFIPIATKSRSEADAFEALFEVLNMTETDNPVVWDFSQTEFGSIHPFLKTALAIYRRHCNKAIDILTQEDEAWAAFGFDDTVMFDSSRPPGEIVAGWQCHCQSMPLCIFPVAGYESDDLQSALQQYFKKRLHIDTPLYSAISYVLGEMCCNVSGHSHSKVGYIAMNYCEEEDALVIIVADAGITIFNSYVHADRYLEEIDGDEAIALKMASEGFSTKNLPNVENRGYGLSTSRHIVVDGLHGAFYLLSGSAFFKYQGGNLQTSVGLPDNIVWPGTAVFIQIPLKADNTFDLNEYTQ